MQDQYEGLVEVDRGKVDADGRIYRSGQVRGMIQVTRAQLRHWGRKGYLHPGRACTYGWRRYGQADIDTIRRLLALTQRGLRLDAAFSLLDRVAQWEERTGRLLQPRAMQASSESPKEV